MSKGVPFDIRRVIKRQGWPEPTEGHHIWHGWNGLPHFRSRGFCNLPFWLVNVLFYAHSRQHVREYYNDPLGGRPMSRTLILILLILVLLAVLPTWPYSSGWGYYPSGALGLILLIVIILVLVGYL
jgi:hypothetical protein